MTRTTLLPKEPLIARNRQFRTARRDGYGRIAAAICACLILAGCSVFSSNPNTRTPGQAFDDEVIERVVRSTIRESDEGFKGTHLNVVSFNGVVLLTGQVPSEALKLQAGEAARTVAKARKVHNEIEIRGPTSHVARTNDSWLTSKVKSKLLADENAPGSRIKVETDNGVVFLMGIVTTSEADAAVAVAQSVFGVQKIVKVFEYVDEPLIEQADYDDAPQPFLTDEPQGS